MTEPLTIHTTTADVQAELEEHKRLTGESMSSEALKAKAFTHADNQGVDRVVLLSDALDVVAETEQSCRLFVDLKLATDQRCDELTESNIERGKRITELERENARLNKVIEDANWLLSDHVDAGGGAVELIKWAQAIFDDHKRAPCRWAPNSDGFYDTSCGQAFYFDDSGTFSDHKCRFCFYCGKKIEAGITVTATYEMGGKAQPPPLEDEDAD